MKNKVEKKMKIPLLNENFKICLVSLSLGKGGAERSCALLSLMLKFLWASSTYCNPDG